MRNLDLNVKKMVKMRGIPLALAVSILATGLTGCGKKAECEVEGNHAHLYTNEEGFNTYYIKEYLNYNGYDRQDEYISLEDKDVELYKFLDKKDLIGLVDNLDLVLCQQEQNQDYIEYRYSYNKKVTRLVGKVPVRRTVTRYSWTSDPNHAGLTGETRVCHYVYQGFNVYKDEYGKYVVIPSEYVDDINELVGNYTYIKQAFYKIINIEDNKELDYEDGPDDNEEYVDDNVQTQSFESGSIEYENGPKLVKSY